MATVTILSLNKIFNNSFYAIYKKFQEVYDKLVSKPYTKTVIKPKKYSTLQIIQQDKKINTLHSYAYFNLILHLGHCLGNILYLVKK